MGEDERPGQGETQAEEIGERADEAERRADEARGRAEEAARREAAGGVGAGDLGGEAPEHEEEEIEQPPRP